jgi:colanic acid/amylovoran biosynthesis glycosyltransferase
MAVGLPVLSTFHSGIPELVEDGVSGYLVAENDVTALTRRLVCLIDQPECWPALGRAGRAKIEADYDIEALNDDLANLYEGLLTPSLHPNQKGVAALT